MVAIKRSVSSNRFRVAIANAYSNGLSLEDISSRLGIPVETLQQIASDPLFNAHVLFQKGLLLNRLLCLYTNELENNLKRLVEIRDHPDAWDGDKINAVKEINKVCWNLSKEAVIYPRIAVMEALAARANGDGDDYETILEESAREVDERKLAELNQKLEVVGV